MTLLTLSKACCSFVCSNTCISLPAGLTSEKDLLTRPMVILFCSTMIKEDFD